MDLFPATLSLEPPRWPVFLGALGALVLCAEVAVLYLHFRPGRSQARSAWMTASALLGGPAMAAVGLGQEGLFLHTRSDGRGWQWLRAGLHGTALAVLTIGLITDPVLGGLLALACAAGLWAHRSYRRTTSPLDAAQRRRLLAMRIGAIVLLGLWALQPTLVQTRSRQTLPVLLLAVDTSASMARRDMLSDTTAPYQTRLEAVRNELTDGQDILRDLLDRADIRWVEFAAQAEPTQAVLYKSAPWQHLSDTPTGQPTAVGDSLQQALDQTAAKGRTVRAVVLFSDGCNNTSRRVDPEELASRLAARSTQVHTVGIGATDMPVGARAMNIRDVGTPQTVPAFRRFSIRPRIEAIGLAGQDIFVRCRFGEEVVEEKRLSPTSDRETLTPHFDHIPTDAGFHRLTIQAELDPHGPTAVTGTPRAEQLVQVVDRTLRILYVEGRYRYESKYLLRALASDDRITVHRHIMLQPLWQNDEPALGRDLEDWLRYHAVILGDVSPKQFRDEQLQHIRTLVGEYGKGLAMIGGSESFGSAWAQTPLADVLGVSLADSGGELEGPLRVVPTTEGEDHPIMQINPPDETVQEAWESLDPQPGANRLSGVKPAAEILARSEPDEPLIVTQPYGKGRTLAIAFDSTWRWVLTPKDTAAMQSRFWRQVALYLCAPKGNVWIHTSRVRYDIEDLRTGRDTIDVLAGVEDAQGHSRPNLPMRVVLTAPDGTETPVSLPAGSRIRRSVLPIPQQEGIYQLKASVEIDGQPLQAEHQFLVQQRDVESLDVLADHDALRRWADAGEGWFLPLADWEDLLEHLSETLQPITRRETRRVNLADAFRWPIALAVIGLLSAEWYHRKKRNLV